MSLAVAQSGDQANLLAEALANTGRHPGRAGEDGAGPHHRAGISRRDAGQAVSGRLAGLSGGHPAGDAVRRAALIGGKPGTGGDQPAGRFARPPGSAGRDAGSHHAASAQGHGIAALPAGRAVPLSDPETRLSLRHAQRTQPVLRFADRPDRADRGRLLPLRVLAWHDPAARRQARHPAHPVRRRLPYRARLAAAGAAFRRASHCACNPSHYSASQALGTAMRTAGIEAFEFVSARDLAGGINVALFTPNVLARKKSVSQEAWPCELSGERVRFRAAPGRDLHDFPLGVLQVAGQLPWLA